MPERATDVQPRKRLADCRSASLASGVAVSLLGLSVLAGYALRVQALKSVVPGLVSMNPATAVSLVLLGLSVALRYFHAGRRSWLSRVGQAAGGLSALAGLAKLLSIAIGHDSVFDRTLFASQMADPAGYASRMSPNTALALLLAGYAAVLLYRERGARGAQRLAVAAMFVAILAVLGYAYGVDAFIGVTGFIPMALNTAVGVLAASSGILLAAPAEGMMGVINGETAGGSMARSATRSPSPPTSPSSPRSSCWWPATSPRSTPTATRPWTACGPRRCARRRSSPASAMACSPSTAPGTSRCGTAAPSTSPAGRPPRRWGARCATP
jgi:hypothetical protein